MNAETPELNPLQELALHLLRNGYHPLALPLGSKSPGYAGWQNRLPTEESVIRDFHGQRNTGLLQGVPAPDNTFLVTIDIDINDHPLMACVGRAIGGDVPTKVGKKGASYLVRAIGEVKSQTLHDYRDGKKRPAGDILGKGKLTVIPPSIHPDTKLPYRWINDLSPLTVRYDELPLINETTIDEIKAFLRDENNPIAALNDMVWKGAGGGGNTHDTCLSAVASMVARGWTDEAIIARIRRAKREACEHAGEVYNWPKDLQTIQEWIDSAREKEFGLRRSKSKPSHGELANFVVAKHGSIIRRDRGRRDWCVFNGKFWGEGATEEVKTLIRSCLPDEQVFKGTIDGIEGVMRLYPELSIEPDRWDADKHLLNCPDGTYDPRSGERYDHDPRHHITKMARVCPRFDYQGSRWLSALDSWFGGDPVELEYIQTLFGLFLTGETRDECVAIWIGKSGAGKTKMTDIMGYILGDYAQTATDTAFLEVRYHPHQEEVARMRGKRLVFIHEVEGYLNLRRVKSIASGEAVSASFKGKDSFEFRPEAKIWFVGNEAPPTKSSGRELQRRFHVYEFMRQIEEKDMDLNLGAKLQDEADQILGWAIDGAKRYYREGLVRSPHVIESTKRYFADADIVEQFIEERCVVEASAVEIVAFLFNSHNTWAEDCGIRHKLDKGRLSQRLKAKGFGLDRRVMHAGKPAVRVVVGLRLRTDDELPFRGVVQDGDQF
jgi:P4 family phage/plasmid primase-like protien